MREIIKIKKSQTADTRSCDYANVTKDQLRQSTIQHIADVNAALAFFGRMIVDSANAHDTDKLTDLDSFHADFLTGFEKHEWWDRHRRLNRHHLTAADGIPFHISPLFVVLYNLYMRF